MSLERFHPQTIDMKALADYESCARQEAVFAVEDSLSRTGFLLMSGLYGDGENQVSQPELAELRRRSEQFFALEDSIKQEYILIGSGGENGYTPFATEAAVDPHTGALGIPEPKELYQLRRGEALTSGVRHIPHAPGFTELLFHVQNKLQAQAHLLYEAIAETLNLPQDYFQRLHRLDQGHHENSVIRALHYPAETDPRVREIYQQFRKAGKQPIRAGAHKDINLLTILLLGQSSRGLQIKPQGSEKFIDVVLGENDDAAGNTGELLETMTGGLYQATLHQVIAYDGTEKSRMSFPCFNHPTNLPDQGLPLLVHGDMPQKFYEEAFIYVYGEEMLSLLSDEERTNLGCGPTQILYKDALLNRLVDIGNFPTGDPVTRKPWRNEKPGKAFVLAR